MVGEMIIRIGRKILEITIFLVKRFPRTLTGLAIGALIGALAGAIPVLSFILGPFIAPLAMALGLAIGAWEDIKDTALRSAIEREVAGFAKMKTV